MLDLQGIFAQMDADVDYRFSKSRYAKDRRQWSKDAFEMHFF